MTKFFMPQIGQQMILKQDWTFNLYPDYRNHSLYEAFGMQNSWEHGMQPVTIPENSVLQLDRIYLRKGNQGYNSLTFYLIDSSEENLRRKKIRFWAKMDEINGIDIEYIEGYKRGKFPRNRAEGNPDTEGAISIDLNDLEESSNQPRI